MPTLALFRLLAKHLIGALSGTYLAACIAHIVGWWWPSARWTAFVLASLSVVISEISLTLGELRHGPQPTGSIILDCMPFLLFGAGVSLFLGRLAHQWLGSQIGGLVVFNGCYFCILLVIAGIKAAVQDRNLKEDLEHPRPTDPEKDKEELRRYMHPYI